MIEVRHLKLIDAVSKLGTLKKAADTLCLTQSALSHQLRELESHLGTRVFDRVNNQLVFTAAGKELKEAGEEIIKRLNKAEQSIQQINQKHLKNYIHGYSRKESTRLTDQANSIAEILHWDSYWEEGSLILEAGCGVGAQTKTIAKQNPHCSFVSLDIAASSLEKAETTIKENGIDNVSFEQANLLDLSYSDDHFDHIFVCFVLEHLPNPEVALQELKRVLKPGGTIILIEGDHGSTYFHPDSIWANKAVETQVSLQAKRGGNANIGRKLFPMLLTSGFTKISNSPRQVYVDDSKPELIEGFVKNTFVAMMEGIYEEAISTKMISKKDMDKGIQDLLKIGRGGGSFCYTFFKATGFKP